MKKPAPKKKKQTDAITLEPWMPIKSPCDECENVIFKVPGYASIAAFENKPIVNGCELSKDGFGTIVPIGKFRDPQKECSKFSSMMKAEKSK